MHSGLFDRHLLTEAIEPTELGLSEYATVVSVTHFSPRESYGKLSPPNAGIIIETTETLREKMPGIEEAPHHLWYNYPNETVPEDAIKYEKNLSRAADSLGLTLYKHPNQGLRTTLKAAIESVETPYVIFLEHDWRFVKSIDIESVIRTFEAHDHVNYIRFNKRENRKGGWDTTVEEDLSMPISLCKSSAFSNNPYIARTKTIRTWLEESAPTVWHFYHALSRNDESAGRTLRNMLRRFRDKFLLQKAQVPIFDDVERVIDTRYKHEIRRVGFERAQARRGIYLYGLMNDGPYVRHLGR